MTVNTSVAFDLLSESVDASLGGNPVSSNIQVGNLTLEPTQILTKGITQAELPEELLTRFTSWITLPAKEAYVSESLVWALVPLRVLNGKVAPSALSIKGALYNQQQQKYPTKHITSMDSAFPRLNPDVCASCSLYKEQESGKVLAVPTLLKKPYPAQDGSMVLKLTYKSDNLNHEMVQALDSQVVELAKSLGVKDGDPFLACFVGYSIDEHAFSGKGGKPPWYAIGFPQGGYALGGCKINTKNALPDGLASLKVAPNLTIKGSGLLERLANELTSTPIAPAPAPAPAPAVIESIPEKVESVEEPEEFVCVPTNDFEIGSLLGDPAPAVIESIPEKEKEKSKSKSGLNPELASVLEKEHCESNQENLPDPFDLF